jgi:hypothetical protein
VGFCSPRVLPNDSDLRRAADVLNAGKKVAILVWRCRWWAIARKLCER